MTIKTTPRFEFDADLVMRATGQAAVTADTATSALGLDVLGAYWSDGELAMPEDVALIVDVEGAPASGGATEETYAVEVQVDSAEGFDDAPVTLTSTMVSAAGRYVLLVARELVEALDPNAAFLRVNMNVEGTAPSIAFGVRAAPMKR